MNQLVGGILVPEAPKCVGRGFIRVALRAPRKAGRIIRVRAKTSAGRVRLVSRKRVVFDMRGVSRRSTRVWVSARTSTGRLLKQRRTYPVCLTEADMSKAVGGMEE